MARYCKPQKPSLRAMRLRRPNCRSLRDLFCVVVTVATISVAITYQLSKYLPPRQSAELNIHFNGRVDIYRSLHPAGGSSDVLASDRHQGLEGVDMEDWERRLAQRHKHKSAGTRHKLRPELVARLKQIELELLTVPGKKRVAGIQSSDSTIPQVALYEVALQRAGYTVIITGNGTDKMETRSDRDKPVGGPSRQVWDTGWSLGLCVDAPGQKTRPGPGVPRPSPSEVCANIKKADIQPHQRINRIPALNSMLDSQEQFCVTMTAAEYIPALANTMLSPRCYVLPKQYQEFLGQADARGPDSQWVLKPLNQNTSPLQLVQPTNERDFLKMKKYLSSESLVQEYVPHPLPLFGLPFSVTAFVLVTSWRPLVAHLHTNGIVYFRHDYQRNFKKVPGRTWSLQQWLHHVAETRTNEVALVAQRNLESVIVETLLATEVISDSNKQRRHTARCHSCFQLLSFELIFNTTFYPVVLNVDSNPDLSDSVSANSRGSSLLHDMISMVTSTAQVATDVALALEELNLEVEISTGLRCDNQLGPQSCLLPGDVKYLLSLRREALQKGGFKLIYPSTDADRYSKIVHDLAKYSLLRQPQVDQDDDTARWAEDSGSRVYNRIHSTAELHTLSVSFLRYLQNVERMEDSYDDFNIPLFSDQHLHLHNKDSSPNLLENVHHNTSNTDYIYTKHSCVEDKDLMPYLEAIHTDPPLNFSPHFNQTVTEYYATVPYHVYLVKVWAFTLSCFSEARLEDKYGLSRPSNLTLGLGSNRVSVVVVDVMHTEPWTINTYTLHIYRQAIGEPRGIEQDSREPVACSLIQDCDLRYLPSQPCGLQPVPTNPTWRQYEKQASVLPPCENGGEPGSWLVACGSCGSIDSCDWGSAIWQPRGCRHRNIDRDQLKQCLTQKQLLFIGDSTNRGMMHYLMEQVNDTLTEWDKTHNIKTYTNINREQTSVSFTYYPQFWLPPSQRPVFDKALFDLIKQSGPLENNHNTVLIVGGVHWLATHHLKVIAQALQREGLEQIRVIVKGLGAGFHQPVDGLHCLTLEEQRKLVIHNSGLLEFARTQGYQVVDTFNMTMARYKDFLQGKCACHFHRVREVLPSFTQFMRSTGQTGAAKLTDMPILYHVEGDINAAYSEILINNICQHR